MIEIREKTRADVAYSDPRVASECASVCVIIRFVIHLIASSSSAHPNVVEVFLHLGRRATWTYTHAHAPRTWEINESMVWTRVDWKHARRAGVVPEYRRQSDARNAHVCVCVGRSVGLSTSWLSRSFVLVVCDCASLAQTIVFLYTGTDAHDDDAN